jgi:hypothetical protein
MKISEILQIPADTVLAEELAGEDVLRDGEPYDGSDGCAGYHFHLDGNGRAWAASEILFAAWALAAELFRHDLRRSDGGGQ